MTHNVAACQARKQLFLNRLQRRCKSYKRLCSQGYNPTELYDWLSAQKKLNTLAYKLLNYVLFLASKNVHAYPSRSFIQKVCRKEDGTFYREESISRVTKRLADRGLLRKWYRGFKKSVALLLNRIFNNPIVQYLIAPLFPFMSRESFNVIYPTLFDCRESFIYRSICLFATDVTYNKYIEYILKKRTERTARRPEPYGNRRESLSKRGGLYNARNFYVKERQDSPKKETKHIGSVLESILQQHQPKFLGSHHVLKEKEVYEHFERPIRENSYQSYRGTNDPFSSGYKDPLEDDSIWQDEDGYDYPGEY